MSGPIEVYESSGNVFADLELPDAEVRFAKAILSRHIDVTIRARRLTRARAARMLGTTQSQVADVVRGRVGSVSMERLIRFLNALGKNVLITVSSAPEGKPGRLLVEP